MMFRLSFIALAIFYTSLLLLGFLFSNFGGFFPKDLENYERELLSYTYEPRAEIFSWYFLKVIHSSIPEYLFFSLSSLLTFYLTSFIILRRFGTYALALFYGSIFPIWYAVYFAQLRFSIFIMLFVLLCGRYSWRLGELLATVLGHFSGLFLVFRYLIFFVPLFYLLIEYLPIRWQFIFDSNEISYRPYFSWELFFIGLLYLFSSKNFRSISIFCAMSAIVLNFSQLVIPVEIVRRILEVVVFSVSPFFYFLKHGYHHGLKLVNYGYVILGCLLLMSSSVSIFSAFSF